MTKTIDMQTALDIVSAGNGDIEIDSLLADLEKLKEAPAANAYLKIAMLALTAASLITEDETARQESIDDARARVQLAMHTEPG
jgi:hypothetical protein